MIVLFGATGYTGRLVAAELARGEGDFVIAGRSEEKLHALNAALDRPPADVRVADARRPETLGPLCAGASVLVSCAGPFTRLGMPVVDAAVAAGVAYVDSTGEPHFMRDVLERHEHAMTPVVPAAGFDYVPHDLAAAVAAEGIDDVGEMDVALLVHRFAMSRGTRASFLEAGKAGGFEFAAGRFREEPIGARRRHFDFPPPVGRRAGVSYPGGDLVQISRHLPGAAVRSFYVVPAAVAPAARSVLAAAGRVMRLGPVAKGADRLVGRTSEGPSEAVRERTAYHVLAEARGPGGTSRALATGHDVYGVTARILAAAARRLGAGGVPGGFRAPSEVVGDPFKFAEETGFRLEKLT